MTHALTTSSRARLGAALAGVLAAVAGAYLALKLGAAHAELVKNAACKANGKGACKAAGGLGGFTSAADALVSPMVVAMAAITPIACIVGGAALMFGSRRGMQIIG